MHNVVSAVRSEPSCLSTLLRANKPLNLELGCGQGEYTLANARNEPDCIALGVDRNGSRLWKGAVTALEEGLPNALFLRGQIEYLEQHISPRTVRKIWLPFPDPLRKRRQAEHRLVSQKFLESYRRLLCPGSPIHIKTDNLDLLRFAESSVATLGGTMMRIKKSGSVEINSSVTVETNYERRYKCLGRNIYERIIYLD